MKRRLVGDEERALWRLATRDVRSLAGERAPPPAVAPKHARATFPATPHAASAKPPAAHYVYGGGDPAIDRAVGTRRLPIERTLDLHGKTQVEAHGALGRFAVSASLDDVRVALVITGKGRGSGTGSGVLRNRFLDWIEEPPLKGLIARVAPAKPRDGGAGAFYVYFKGKNRST